MPIGLQDDGLLPADRDAQLGTDDLVNVALALIANVDRSRIVEREADAGGWY